MLIKLFEDSILENKQLIINWTCNYCNKIYSENLLTKVVFIREEFTLAECRPDIALLDKEENVFAVIEIVVSHKPEEHVIQYYKDNKIILIQINLLSEDDLKKN